MNKIEKGFTKFNEVINGIAGIILLVVMTLITLNVIMRAVFSSPINFTYDVVEILSAIVISLSLAYCAIYKGHIAIDYFVEKLPIKAQEVIDSLTGLISGMFLI